MLLQVLSDVIVWYDDLRYYAVISLYLNMQLHGMGRSPTRQHCPICWRFFVAWLSMAALGQLFVVLLNLLSISVPFESLQRFQRNFHGMSSHGYPHVSNGV